MESYEERIKMIEEMSGESLTESEKEVIKISRKIIKFEKEFEKGEIEKDEAAVEVLGRKLDILLMTVREDVEEYEYIEGVKEVFDAIKPLDGSDFKTEILAKIEKKINYFIDRMKEESRRENKRNQEES